MNIIITITFLFSDMIELTAKAIRVHIIQKLEPWSPTHYNVEILQILHCQQLGGVVSVKGFPQKGYVNV
jgi:hypothetical protein